jgi:hypothetical protein
MESSFDTSKKTNVVNFEWVDTTRDLQTAAPRIQEIQAPSLGKYVAFNKQTSAQIREDGTGSGAPNGIAGRRAAYFHFSLAG